MVAHIFFLPMDFTTIITILTIFFIRSTSNGYAYEYYECSSSWSCGNLTNIGYPFWGGKRHQSCGRPELRLNCTGANDHPVLQIGDPGDDSSVSLLVLGISNSSKRLTTVKLIEKHPNSAAACPTDFIENHVFKDIFKFSPNVNITRLFHDCPGISLIKTPHNDSVTCSDIDNQSRIAYYLQNHSDSYNLDDPRYKDCKFYEAPVLKKELNKLKQQKEALTDVLNQGFEVDFYSTGCINCQNSGGVCDSSPFSPHPFVCYCKDGPHSQDCGKSGKWKMRLTLGLGSLGGGLVILIGLVIFCYKSIRSTRQFVIFSKRRATQHQNIEAFLKIYGSLAPKRYTYANIRKMTNYFKDKLGEGGYANVYKGKLHDGQLVAVKKLKQVKSNGDDFINEVASIGRTNHVNIVALLGFCFEGKKRALIYEFMSNGSLERFTYGGASYMSLSWEKLFDIALGIAKGLDYLHRGCNARILHFDIKPHNILLDEEFRPKISDFGLARLCPQQESTISMLEARGTIGYIAPEVFSRNFGGVSHKSDVYSYGMMVLDLVCGRTNVSAKIHHSSELYFPEWIYSRLELGEEFIVPGTLNDEDKDLQRKMILISLWCIQTYPSSRPSMSRVVEMLNGCLEWIQMPPKPYISSPPRLTPHTSETSTII